MNDSTSQRAKIRTLSAKLPTGELFTLGAILLSLIVIMAIVTNGATIHPTNLRNILIESSVRGIVAMGMAFVLLTGAIDVSVGGMAIFTAVLGTVFMAQLGLPIPVALILMWLVGAGIGSFSGFAVARIRMNPLVVTLALWIMAPGAAYLFTHGTTLYGIPESYSFFGLGRIMGVPVPVIVFVIVIAIAHVVLTHTPFGRAVYAVGTNKVAARLSGIKTIRTQALVFVISGSCAALAGAVVLGRLMCSSNTMISNLELDAIASCVIGGVSLMGGKGKIAGAVIGVLIIGVVNNSLTLLGVTPALVPIAKGAIILLAVMVDSLRRRE
jgi:ribose/xylose/arabinose/galactoside ABC-type transport system permease subunit